ncbi:MAG: hypothetical protein ACYCZI_10670, partial [Metallibacterium scheffleri]
LAAGVEHHHGQPGYECDERHAAWPMHPGRASMARAPRRVETHAPITLRAMPCTGVNAAG